MAKCKICGQTVRSAPVFHPACWEAVTKRMAEEFCDEYCRFPREIEDTDSLHELHCDDCALIRVLNLGVSGGNGDA